MANVNKPINISQKEADVNRKLQFYGILNAFQNGKVPSNEQIDVALNSFLESKALSSPPSNLSAEGKTLLADVREVVKQAKNLVLSKNEGNLLQDFIWQTQQFDTKSVPVPGAPVQKETAQQHGNQALEGLRTLGTLLITNGQFRKLLKDASVLFRDMAGDAAAEAATRVKPPADALAGIDKPAEDNVWHDKPDLSKDTLKKQIQGIYKGDVTQDAQDVAAAGTSAAHPSGSSDPADLASAARREGQTGQPSGVDAVGGVTAAANALQEKAKANIDPETQEKARAKAREYRARAKEYFSKKMPEERREQVIWRLKKMVVECQQHPDYMQAIQTLLDLAEMYGGHANELVKGGTSTVQESRSALSQAENDLKTLIERFANGTSTNDLWESINQIYRDADRDEELKGWFKSFDGYMRRCLLEQGYVLEESSTQDWKRLYDKGNYLFREKYRTHTDRIVDEIKFVVDQFDQDPQNKAFAASVKKLFTDLGNDKDGKPTFKPHLIKDLTEVIIPSVFESIAYVPVPRIEYSDPQIDAVIENLVLESDNFMPNVLEIATENFMRWGRKKLASKSRHSVDVKVVGVQMDLRDVSYYVKRKQGFPSLTDTGVANILLAGDGFSFRMKMSSGDEKDPASFLKVDKVDVDVKNLQIKLVKSNHKFLFSTFKSLMIKVLRPALQKSMEKAIRDQFNVLNQFLYRIKQEADRVLEEAQNDPENIPNIYSRYVSAAQKQMLLGKQKAEAIAATRKVNYAVTKEDSIFPDIHLPGGISSKATEYKQLAREGDMWESPVFSIGHASASSDVPAAPAIARKEHATAVTNEQQTNGVNGSTKVGGLASNPVTTSSST